MSRPTIIAWDREPELVDETEFTPWANRGWLSWNGQSPEADVCFFAQSLVLMMQPALVVETGVGQGYMTRALASVLGDSQQLVAYESNDQWREAIWNLPFWLDRFGMVTLSVDPSPTSILLEVADLAILDSDWDYRFEEIQLWHEHAKSGAVAIIHDTSDQPDTIHASLRTKIVDLGLTGFFLRNPRGCFVAVKP